MSTSVADLNFVTVRGYTSAGSRGTPVGTVTERRPEWSGRDAVAQVQDAVAESVLVEELEVGADARREGRLSAAEDHGPDEQLALVHEAGLEGPGSEVRPADGEVAGGFGLQFLDGVGVEVSFEASGGCRDCGQGGGVDDLVGRPPGTREVGGEV